VFERQCTGGRKEKGAGTLSSKKGGDPGKNMEKMLKQLFVRSVSCDPKHLWVSDVHSGIEQEAFQEKACPKDQICRADERGDLPVIQQEVNGGKGVLTLEEAGKRRKKCPSEEVKVKNRGLKMPKGGNYRMGQSVVWFKKRAKPCCN